MKRIFIILMVIISCFLGTIVSAKTVKDVACYYRIVNSYEEFMTDAVIYIEGYNDGTGGTLNIQHRNQDGTYIKSSSSTYDWQNYGKTDNQYNVYLNFSIKKANFIKAYKDYKGCPNLVSSTGSAGNMDTMYIKIDESDANAMVKAIVPVNELLKGDDGKWSKKTDFYKDDSGQTTVKDDLVCTYEMYFERYNIKTNVKFTTMYDASDNSKKTYKLTVGEQSSIIYDFNDDVSAVLTQGSNEFVHVKKEQLSKIFTDSCLPGEKVYHYYDGQLSGYIITTDKQEAIDNSYTGDYDNGAASNDGHAGEIENSLGQRPQNPGLEINGGTSTCTSLLGNGLTKVLKLAINAIRIIAVIISIVMAMVKLLPPLSNGDKSELQKAAKSCIWIAVVLIIAVMMPTLVKVIGKLFGLDTSCL